MARNVLNEFTIRNSLQTEAIRFDVTVNGNSDKYIGDGVVVATPHGSSAYYYSITRKTFDKGIGMAFNNPHTENAKNTVLDKDSEIQIKITRGDAFISSDNDKEMDKISEGDIV